MDGAEHTTAAERRRRKVFYIKSVPERPILWTKNARTQPNFPVGLYFDHNYFFVGLYFDQNFEKSVFPAATLFWIEFWKI